MENLFEDSKFFSIEGPVLRIWCIDVFEIHQAGDIIEGNLAQPDRGNPGGAASPFCR
jgi:hypothetical protein